MSDSIKTNERELAGKIAQWFNEIIAQGNYPFQSASNETGIKAGPTTYFGDIVIWQNDESRKAFSYIEIKPPFGANEDLDRFCVKANKLNIKIAYTWNFQNLNAYNVGNNKVELLDSESNPVLTVIDNWRRGDCQALIKAYIRKICEELLSISATGRFRKFKPEKHYFINFLRDSVNSLIPVYERFVKAEHGKKENKDIINKFVAEQGIAYPSDDEFYKLIASQSVYGLVTKIIFYLTIRRYFTDLPDLIDEENDLNTTIKKAFSKASEKDWQAVFIDSPIEELGIPEDAYDVLIGLFANLKIYSFGELPEDVIGELFEELIDPEHRHILGQYFTREDLVDLVIGTIVNDPAKTYADPTCGSGTFLIRLYSRLRYLNPRLRHEEILSKIWGIDIGKFPAELSTINLFRQDVSNFENFPRVLKSDIFHVNSGTTIDFPPPNAGKSYVKVKINVPRFYGLVGNFPFIRQELVEKKIKGYKDELTRILAGEYLFHYPGLFDINNKQALESIEDQRDKSENDKAKYIDHLLRNNYIDIKLSGQADIYAYIYLHVTQLLDNNGSLAIITSNSWLDVAYGAILKQFLLDHYKIRMIVASWAEPWFDDAAVNTVFTVLERCDNPAGRDENPVRFVKIKRKLTEIIGRHDLQVESHRRWQRIDALVRVLDTAPAKAKVVAENISSFEDENFRVRIVKQVGLSTETNQDSELSKWGKYLRAPDVYFEIVDKCADKLVPLKDIAEIKFGIKTGINEFFYLEPINIVADDETSGVNEPMAKYLSPGLSIMCKNARGWQGEIESAYLKKIIKSPKESDTIIIDPEKLRYFLFVCNKSKEDLKKLNHLGALRYIEWGDKQRTPDNMPWPEVPSVKGRKCWWWLLTDNVPDIIFPCGIADSFRFFDNTNKLVNDKRLYEIYTQNNNVKLYLLSTLSSLFIETETRVGLGDGLLDLTVYELANTSIIKDIPEPLADILVRNYRKIAKRSIGSIFKEVKQKDRQELDKAVLEALGLDANEFLPRIYEGLTEMVHERLEMPKLRKKQQKQKIIIAYDQIKQSVISECIGKSIKQFPAAFYSIGDYQKLDFDIYNTSGLPLHTDYFMGQITLKDESGQVVFVTEKIEIARYALFLAKPDVFRLKIPKDLKAIANIVGNYSNYIKTLHELIETNAHQKLHSWFDAEKMTHEIMNEFDLNLIDVNI
jgi:hypothetical protein